MTPIAPHITDWFYQRLPVERAASPHTCDNYAITFRLLFSFAAERLSVAPSNLAFEHVDAPLVLAFLDHLQTDRNNGARTRNNRLAAIKSFMRFMEYRHPGGLDQIRRILAIPGQRVDVKSVSHLSRTETQALLDAPDPTTRGGIRDRALMLLAVTGGLRVSELVRLRLDQMSFRDSYLDLRILGKGRKERVLTLWSEVAEALQAWLSIRGDVRVTEVFLNGRGRAMTRSGIEYVVRKHARNAGAVCSSLLRKRISPHVLRHTCAVNTLQATRDIRKVALWLGHSSTRTTEIYLQADPVEKLEILEAVVPPSLRPGTFSPPDQLIAMLQNR